jgi:hypothetical protein
MNAEARRVCQQAEVLLRAIQDRARIGVLADGAPAFDAAFLCPLSMIHRLLDAGSPAGPCSCGEDYPVGPQEVGAMLEGAWGLCGQLLKVARECEVLQERRDIGGVCAHILRDIIEPQFRAYPQYRAQYEPEAAGR